MNGIANTEQAPASVRSFAEELRHLRGTMTLRRLAELSHFSSGHISNVENGTKPPTEEFARACDLALNTGGRLLALLTSTSPRGHVKSPRPAQLPPSPRLIGREGILQTLDQQLHRAPDVASAAVIALDGPAGVGKTTLAVAWAHQIKNHFPDGVFYVDLRGYASDGDPVDVRDVLDDILKALGVSPEAMPTTLERRSALLRSMLDGTRTMLLLDNAACADQVRFLIPAAPGCLVLVTSRRRLSALAVRHGARCVSIEPFEQDEALTLLREVVGPARVDVELDAAKQVVESCGGLPLAVRVAAERIAASRHLTLTRLADDLSAVDQRLNVLSPADVDGAVRAVFSWSFRALEPDAARLFRLLSLHPGREFGVDAAAALTQYEPAEAARLLDTLVSVHLLEEVGYRRFRFHDLLRDYATEQLVNDTAGESVESTQRLLEWYLGVAATASRVMSPNRPQVHVPVTVESSRLPSFGTANDALQWCETELANLAAAAQLAVTRGLHAIAFGLPMVLTDYLYWRNPWSTWMAPLQSCLEEACKHGDLVVQAWILNNIGNAHLDQHSLDEAMTCFRRAFDTWKQLGDRIGQAWSRTGIGRTLQAKSEHAEAAAHYRLAQAACVEVGDKWVWAIATAYLADTDRALGDHDTALDQLDLAVAVLRDLGDRQSESCALDKIGDVYRDQGKLDSALDYLDQARAVRSFAADRWGEAALLGKIGEVNCELGRTGQARQAWQEALQLFEALGDSRATAIRARLAALEGQVAPVPRRAS
ncbi:ATP-binding protein [Saccharothrix saharensis]|uniref:ATP-binding protein n=1 Tax=Saccharothrix saharensis TaxID=571190 RepID=UPI003691BBBF